MRRWLVLALIVLSLTACGRVGPPVRREATPSAPPPTAPVPVDDEDEDEERF